MSGIDDSYLENLLVQLNGTGLQQKDQKLYQYLLRLLRGTEQIAVLVAAINTSSGSSVVNNYITKQFLDAFSSDGQDGLTIPGPAGATGSTGASGIGIPGQDGNDGSDWSGFPPYTPPPVPTDYVLMSDGSTPPLAMNNGGSSFLYIGYLP